MRLIISLILSTAFPAIAIAHTLPGDESIGQQLQHQLLGGHHLPLLLLIVVAGFVLYRVRHRVTGRVKKQ